MDRLTPQEIRDLTGTLQSLIEEMEVNPSLAIIDEWRKHAAIQVERFSKTGSINVDGSSQLNQLLLRWIGLHTRYAATKLSRQRVLCDH